MLFFAAMIYAKAFAEILGIPSMGELIQIVCFSVSLLSFIFGLGCLAQYAERAAARDKHDCLKFSAGLRVLAMLIPVTIVYASIRFIPGNSIIYWFFFAFMAICLPAVIIRAAVNDSIKAGLHAFSAVITRAYITRLALSLVISMAYSLLAFAITQALAYAGTASTTAYYITAALGLLVYVILLCSACMTSISLLANVVE